MTATRTAPPSTAGAVEQSRRLPRSAPWGLFALGLLVGAGLSAVTGFSLVLTAIYGVAWLAGAAVIGAL